MLAVAGGKGGCGKTTTTLGLAAALVRQRKSAVAIDADREMPNLHAMAGVSREPGLDAVADGWPPEFVAGTADAPAFGVEVIPAASGPRTAPSSSPITALARVGTSTDAVLLDCPAGAGPDAVAPLRVADAAVVVTTAEPACLRDAAKTAAMARELDTPVAGAVVSRAVAPRAVIPRSNDPRSDDTRSDDRPSGDTLEGVARLLDCQILGVVPDVGPESEFGSRTETGHRPEPLAADRVRAAYDDVVSALQPKYL